jgi:hypothetical protein
MITPFARQSEEAGRLRRRAILQARFRKSAIWRSNRGAQAVRLTFVAYWVACLGVIGFGLDRLHPEIRRAAVRMSVTRHGEQPFANCAAAHAAGVYNIPTWSLAYTVRQDGDGDGLACEPGPGKR